MNEFNGKIAIVTGGASGLGRALSIELVRLGAKVIVADIDIKTVTTQQGKLQAALVDVTQPEQIQTLVDQVVREYGQLDFIFNNAGMMVAGEVRDMYLEDWNHIIDLNLKGVIHGVQAAYPVMIKQGFGHIINTASQGGLIACPAFAAYSTTKYAVVGLSNALRSEAEGFGVKVSAICPGFIQTNLLNATIYRSISKEALAPVLPIKPMNVDKAVQQILRGVARNQPLIVFPNYTRLLWWIHRLNQGITNMMNRKVINGFRKIRDKNVQAKPEQIVNI
jgi:NAD(P)-dependent dehydrogenase (short-subunit alcohol dehydrogenase family)